MTTSAPASKPRIGPPSIREYLAGERFDGTPIMNRAKCNKLRERRGLEPLPLLPQCTTTIVQRSNPATSSPRPAKTCCQRGGVGTEMKKLLRELDVPSGWCESCSQRAALMDSNGVEWCRKNRSTIVGWLQEAERNFATAAARVERNDGEEPTEQQIRKARDAQRWRTGWAAATKFVWIDPRDPFGSLIDTAIARAESAAKCELGACEA